nr:SIR2 family protein [Chitinophaga rhizophila]
MIVPVAGAGVSAATAGVPGWKELVDKGIQYARTVSDDAQALDKAQELSDANKLTDAATILKKALKAPKHPYSNWLNDVFGRPTVKNPALIQSIHNLCQPIIATTNYDTLLSSVGMGYTDRTLDWKQHEEIQSCINKGEPFILHMHGIYSRPKTPIFGSDDYKMLRRQTGYKTVLTNLWMSRHFLFIGCSRDGVMDEDFITVLKLMQAWFPGDQREHYILMPKKKIGTTEHRELLHSCNVHLVSFGDSYDELPNFLNSINPNIEEMMRRFADQRSAVHDSVVSILSAQPSYMLSATVSEFIRESLGIVYPWVATNRVKVFEQALRKYNTGQVSKQKQFANYQVLVRTEIGLEELQEKIDLWNNSGGDMTRLNNVEYINTAVVAYEMLKSFPKEMLEDINKRHYYLINYRYFKGSLESYYWEAKRWTEGNRDPRIYGEDRYFFENLKRIMQSLVDVLTISCEEIYGEKTTAKLVHELPLRQLLVVYPKLLTICNDAPPYKVLAELPWDKNLEFVDAQLVHFRRQKIAVGYNSDHCFKWNPLEDLISTDFFTVDPNESILGVNILEEGTNVVVEVFTNEQRVVIVNFDSVKKYSLAKGRFRNYVRLQQPSKIYCEVPVYTGQKGYCIFEMNNLGEYQPRISLEGLWQVIFNIPEAKADYEAYFSGNKDNELRPDVLFPFIQDVNLRHLKWLGIDILGVRVRYHFGRNADSTALLFINPFDGIAAPLSIVLFREKNCFCYDIRDVNGHMNLVVGFLDTGDIGNLIQYFERIDVHKVIVAGNEPGLMQQDRMNRSKIRDMYDVVFVSDERAIINEEAHVLHDVNLITLHDTKTEFEYRIQSVRYCE